MDNIGKWNLVNAYLMPKFEFDNKKYKGAKNPNLDGRAVLVINIKEKNKRAKFIFVDIETEYAKMILQAMKEVH